MCNGYISNLSNEELKNLYEEAIKINTGYKSFDRFDKNCKLNDILDWDSIPVPLNEIIMLLEQECTQRFLDNLDIIENYEKTNKLIKEKESILKTLTEMIEKLKKGSD
jgi:hypothetical protein